jgi:hypothetical protein
MSEQADSSVPTHAIQRSISKLAHGIAQEIRSTEQRRKDGALVECVEQFQISVSGTASDYPGWLELELNFNQRFTIGTGNRESNLQRPHFHSSFELTTGQSQNATVIESAPGGVTRSDPVIFHAVVTEWVLDDMAMVSGCKLKLGAVAPGDTVVFQGFVHVSFQGLGAPIQDEDTQE